MNFGEALALVQQGEFMSRRGWNGKNMFIYFVQGTMVPVADLRGNAQKAAHAKWSDVTGNGGNQSIRGHIDMMAADGSIVVGWLASQSDMLAIDWEITFP